MSYAFAYESGQRRMSRKMDDPLKYVYLAFALLFGTGAVVVFLEIIKEHY
jgi:hypothetical protein